jgi:hypothetical protein
MKGLELTDPYPIIIKIILIKEIMLTLKTSNFLSMAGSIKNQYLNLSIIP